MGFEFVGDNKEARRDEQYKNPCSRGDAPNPKDRWGGKRKQNGKNQGKISVQEEI